MKKINKFESISTIKSIGVLTSVIFLLSTLYNVINIILGYGSIFTIILPVVFFAIGLYMFINPIKKVFFIYLSLFAMYFVINIGLIVMISGYEYFSQIIFEGIWLIYFIYKYMKIKGYNIDETNIKEYDESIKAFEKNKLFYFSVTSLLGTRRWICTNYEKYILVRYNHKYMKKLIDKSTFKFDFGNLNSKVLIGYINYNGKRKMCKIKKVEYETYKKVMKQKYMK